MDEIIETRFNNVPVLPVQQNLFNDIITVITQMTMEQKLPKGVNSYATFIYREREIKPTGVRITDQPPHTHI